MWVPFRLCPLPSMVLGDTAKLRVHVVDFLHTLDIRGVPTACQRVSLGIRDSTSGSQRGDQRILVAQDLAGFSTGSPTVQEPPPSVPGSSEGWSPAPTPVTEDAQCGAGRGGLGRSG